MSISSVVVANDRIYFNFVSPNGVSSLTNYYPIFLGDDGERLVNFEDHVEYECFLNYLESEFGSLNLGAFCVGGYAWEDNALHLEELLEFLKENEVSVIVH